MLRSDLIVSLLSSGLLLSFLVGTAGAARAEGRSLAEELRAVGQQRIFFGHQSVGFDILDGLRDLAREAGVPLRILETAPGDAAAGPAFLHARLGENTRPQTKLAAFEAAMEAPWADRPTVALVKFCYVDIDADTDVEALFARYASTYERLVARHPGVSWVHVTVPLTVTQAGIKGYLKSLLGRAVPGERENMNRHAFNELLRARYGGKVPLFDLAAAEATREDGTASGFERDGRTYPSLDAAYTDDGEHLNERGRRHVARALVATLAALR